MTPNPLPTVLSATKPIPALRALRPGALPLLLTGVLALPATPQQPSAPLTTATETAEHNEDRHHLEEAASKEERPREIQNGIGMEFVLIPAGTFRMGGSGLRADPSEKPRHEVTITRPFYIGKYEVTQGQWQAVMGSNPSFFDECGERCPVDSVSLIDAQGLAGRLNEMEGTDSYRLPTEAEWEYAARAGSEKDRYGPVDEIAWHLGNASDRTHPVGGKMPNAFGLHDTLGNVAEWVQDWFGPYSKKPQTDPTGPESGRHSVVRGHCGLGQNFRGRGCRVGFRGFITNHGQTAQKAAEAAAAAILGGLIRNRTSQRRDQGDKGIGLRLAKTVPAASSAGRPLQ